MGGPIGRAWRRLRPELAERFAIDPRALAAYRIALAALVLGDLLAYRAPDLAAFYTDQGVLPRAVLGEVFPRAADLSLHTVTGSPLGQAILLGVTALAALALLVGSRTRWAALATWVLLASMQARNPHVVNAGDTLVLVTLFFGLFLPLGERWSLDARRRGSPPPDAPVVSAATVGLLLQIVVVYVSNLGFKLSTDLWLEGDAVAHAFAFDDYTVFLGDALAEGDAFLAAANWAWLAALVAAPLLIALTGWARGALVAVFAGLHVGMMATLWLGVFPLVAVAALLVFVPAEAWDHLEARLAILAESGSGCRPAAGAERWSPPGAVQAGLAALIVAGLAWHGMALGLIDRPGFVDDAGRAGEHRWQMFAPPSPTYGWVKAPANSTGNATVDALQLEPGPAEAPADLSDAYPSTLWHRYLKDLPELTSTEHEALAAHLCQRAEAAFGPVASIELVFVEHQVRLDGPDPVQERSIHAQRCPDR
jgi:hypothetical protein